MVITWSAVRLRLTRMAARLDGRLLRQLSSCPACRASQRSPKRRVISASTSGPPPNLRVCVCVAAAALRVGGMTGAAGCC